MTHRQLVSAGVVFSSMLMFTPIMSALPQLLRIFETFYCIPPSEYRYYTVGVILSEMLSGLIWIAAGVVVLRKRIKITEWLLAKMNTGSERDAEQ